MPRKRKTRKNNVKAQVDADASMVVTDEVQFKKEAFLRDFDLQVADRVAQMESEWKRMLNEMNKLFSTTKLSVKKEIRRMTKKEFLENGGDWATLDFSPVVDALDISTVTNNEDRTLAPLDNTAIPLSSAKRPVRQVGRKRTAVAESPLVNDITRTETRTRGTRSTRNNLYTPHVVGRGKNTLVTPMITPKFDMRKPLTMAREPKHGETLVSLSGSPVVHQNLEQSDDNVVSLVLNKDQTLLGGSLFNVTMSPSTLMKSKERLEEAIAAINARVGDLDSKIVSDSTTEN